MLPLLVFLLVGIVDLARIYTTMLSVESAAREAADYGSFGSQKWAAAPAYTTTISKMQERACIASKNLTDYVGPDTACSNPSFSYQLAGNANHNDWQAYDAAMTCDDAARTPPCWVKVTLTYNFNLLVPLHIDLFGLQLGLPPSLTFTRTSIFPMTDLSL